jgi:hypothetical protein
MSKINFLAQLYYAIGSIFDFTQTKKSRYKVFKI